MISCQPEAKDHGNALGLDPFCPDPYGWLTMCQMGVANNKMPIFVWSPFEKLIAWLVSAKLRTQPELPRRAAGRVFFSHPLAQARGTSPTCRGRRVGSGCLGKGCGKGFLWEKQSLLGSRVKTRQTVGGKGPTYPKENRMPLKGCLQKGNKNMRPGTGISRKQASLPTDQITRPCSHKHFADSIAHLYRQFSS